MQDVQNIPNPDVNTNETDEEFGSHSELNPHSPKGDIETPGEEGDVGEAIPLPADRKPFPSLEDPTVGDGESDLM